MSLQIEPLASGNTDGVIVRGITEARLREPGVADSLRQLWIERGLIVFKTEPSMSLHVALSAVFGELEHHPVKDLRAEGHPELITLAARPGDSATYVWQGETRASWIPWHTDLIYTPCLNHGGILRGLIIPDKGGITGFMDKIKVYQSLPDDLKARIEDLDVVYKMHFDMSLQKYGVDGEVLVGERSASLDKRIEREDIDFPPVVHPLVYTQIETGRKLLNLSPLFAEYVVGLSPEESDTLLRTLSRHILKEEFAYFHDWEPEDMVLWDNWRMLHTACGIDPMAARTMQRTTIAGDYAQGRPLAA
jgi:taurine dioxygenase